MAESVELATILFTDLVGSTRLATSVGPVRADQLREEHFALLADAIASSKGKEVKNTGDGVMVAFPSTSEAVKCAVAMQQLFERRYRQAEQGLHIRIGVGAGEATVKDGDYFGVPPTEAARLCAQAPTDGILISAGVKMFAGRCEGIEFHSVGELELKGLPDKVEAFSVWWAPLAEGAGEPSGRWPLPALLRSVPPVAYVGRIDERVALEQAMNLARSGQHQVVLLSGEPGIGKTRLSSYAAHRAHAEGFAVAWGACSEELAVPYEPWMAVCSQLVESAPDELLAGHVERHGGELRRLVRNLRGRIGELPESQSSDPETERYLLFSAVVGLLGDVAGEVPLCVVLDDLHWADAQSLALLKHLLRGTEHGALKLIATYRDSDLGKDHPLTGLLADLRSLQGVQRIALHGLGTDEVAEVMAAIAGHELADDGMALAAQIADESDGNPFFVGEILRGLSESGALAFDEQRSRWRIDTSGGIALPESVREVIERRVERLGEEALEALRLAAVIGRSFELKLLSALVETDESRLLDYLEAAVAASLLSESTEQVGQFRFVHALINQTLYEGLGPTRRARMHERVAQALELLYGAAPEDHLPELALHWRLAAVSVDKSKAADYSLRAGRQALEKLAPAEAVKLFGDAVELGGEDDTLERGEALIGLGTAQRQTGDRAYRDTLLAASRIASALIDGELAARAALANHRRTPGSGGFGRVDQERVEAIERALVLGDPADSARRARLLALQAQELSYGPDFARRSALGEEAMTLARGAGDRSALAEVLESVFFGVWSAETLELRSAVVTELASLAAELRDPAIERAAAAAAGHVCAERGDFANAELALERLRAIAEELGQPTLRWICTYQTAGFELAHGRLDTGERLAEQAFEIAQQSDLADAAMIYGAQISVIRFIQGRSNEVIEMMERSAKTYPGIPAWQAGLALQLCWLERYDDAGSILEQAASDRFEHITPNQPMLGALALYADVAARMRNVDAARALRDRLEPFSEQFVWLTSAGYGHVRLYLGLLADVLGDHERSDEHLRFACEFHDANDMPVWAARGHVGWAEALAARGDAAGAREQATRALELAREHGYGGLETRAAALAATASAAMA